jgi:hypothetical protein
MRFLYSSGVCRTMTLACCAGVTAMVIPIDHVSAQEDPWPSNADTNPGQIVYSRDVPYGSATRRFDQGEAATVNTDHSVLIADSLLVGLEPLTDAEQASVSAPLNSAFDTSRSALQIGLSALNAAQSSEVDFTRAENGATGVGGIISNSLGVLPAALGAVGRVLGGGE